MIGRSNRGPSARPRVQSSNEAEEELLPKAGEIGRRVIHTAGPAPCSIAASATALRCAVWVSPAAAPARGGGGVGGGEGEGCGKFKKKGKALPLPVFPPFSFCACIDVFMHLNRYFLLDAGLERPFYFTVALGKLLSSQREKLAAGSGSVRALCALKLDLSSA